MLRKCTDEDISENPGEIKKIEYQLKCNPFNSNSGEILHYF